MKYFSIISIGTIVASTACGIAAAETRLDRPSPPARCVDGVCVPHPASYGYFQTRWRTWPGISPEATGVPTMPSPSQSLPPYEMPTPEKEDLRAPPPTKAPAEKPATEGTPGTVPPAGGTTPPGATTTTPPAGVPQLPPLPQFPAPTSPTPQNLLQPAPLQQPTGSPSPLQRPTTTPLGEGTPFGDLDPPPSPRFAAGRAAPSPVLSRMAEPVAVPAPQRVPAPGGIGGARSAQRTDGDPPPALPFSFGGAAL